MVAQASHDDLLPQYEARLTQCTSGAIEEVTVCCGRVTDSA